MSDHKEHITQYSAADIQRYVQGKLSAREMHAMEKAALDDPFLADAMEGMQEALADHNESLVTGQLQQLQQQFQTRTTSTAKVVAFKPFRYWQAAAAVIVIVTGVWIYSLVSDSSPSENSVPVVAKTEDKKPSQQAPAPALTDGKETFLSTDSTSANDVATNKTYNNTPTPGYRNVDNMASAKNKTAETIPAPAPTAQNGAVLSRSRTDTGKQADASNWGAIKQADKDVATAKQEAASPVASAAAPEYKKAQKESAYNNVYQDRERETELITIKKSDSPKKTDGFNNNLTGVIKGKVTDQNNNPIANAYVQVTKNNNNIITDKTGFFKIPVSDSVVDVAVNVTGYGTQNFRLQNNADINQLQLQPANAALDEVVIPSAKGRKLAAFGSKRPNNIVHDAEPLGGWTAFDQYLEKNKNTPSSGLTPAGQVIVSFEVNKKGILSGFKIEQSLAKVYDDEAIRLITQGPSWKLLKKGRKARITVRVRF